MATSLKAKRVGGLRGMRGMGYSGADGSIKLFSHIP